MLKHSGIFCLLLFIWDCNGYKISTRVRRSNRLVTQDEMKIVNSDGAFNNCVYATAAGCQGKTIQQMLNRQGSAPMYVDATEIQTPNQVLNIIQQSGYSQASMQTFQTENQVLAHATANMGPNDPAKTYALAYEHANAPGGHVVAMKVWKNPNGQPAARLIDFQKSPAQRHDNQQPNGRAYHLIELGPQPRSGDSSSSGGSSTRGGSGYGRSASGGTNGRKSGFGGLQAGNLAGAGGNSGLGSFKNGGGSGRSYGSFGRGNNAVTASSGKGNVLSNVGLTKLGSALTPNRNGLLPRRHLSNDGSTGLPMRQNLQAAGRSVPNMSGSLSGRGIGSNGNVNFARGNRALDG